MQSVLLHWLEAVCMLVRRPTLYTLYDVAHGENKNAVLEISDFFQFFYNLHFCTMSTVMSVSVSVACGSVSLQLFCLWF